MTVDATEETASNGPETTDSQSHTRISFIPETGLKDLVNKPFAHFQSVLLKDEVHFTDLPEDETGVESQEAVTEVEKKMEYISVNPVTKQRFLVPPELAVRFKSTTSLKGRVKNVLSDE